PTAGESSDRASVSPLARLRSYRHPVALRERIVHLPQHVELEFQDLERTLLQLARPREMLERDRETVLDVAARETDAALKIDKALALDPRIELGPTLETLPVDLGREELRQRRAHRLLPRRLPREVHVRVDGEANAGQQILEALHALSVEADRVGEAKPRLDAALVLAVTVVIENPPHPEPSHASVRAIRQDRRVLQRNVDLVVVAIRDPSLDLLAGRAPGVQHHVERMVDVIPLAERAQPPLELLSGPGCLAQSSISMPSKATSTPSRSSTARSSERSSRIGFVLLMWIRIFRVVPGSAARCSSMP